MLDQTYTSYTFSINQLKQEDNSFRNLIVNVFDNKTTASINTYIPDNKYTQRKKTDKKANFSGKVYFTEYIEDLTNLLKRFKLKSQFNKSSTVVCFEQIQIVNFPCKGNQRHWINEECPN